MLFVDMKSSAHIKGRMDENNKPRHVRTAPATIYCSPDMRAELTAALRAAGVQPMH